jgi:hypothetical protein
VAADCGLLDASEHDLLTTEDGTFKPVSGQTAAFPPTLPRTDFSSPGGLLEQKMMDEPLLSPTSSIPSGGTTDTCS